MVSSDGEVAIFLLSRSSVIITNIIAKKSNLNGKRLNHLKFADDVLIITDNKKDRCKIMLEDLEERAKNVGLKMNMQKTKIMRPEEKAITSIDNKYN